MRITHRIILASFLAGLLVWLMDAVIDEFFFYKGGFWDLFILKASGHEIYIRLFILAVFVGFGILASRIVANLEEARREMSNGKQHYLTTLRGIGDGVIATDANGRVTFMNPVAETLTGWDFENAVEKPIHDVFSIVNEKSGSQVENPVDRVIREGTIVGLANHTVLISKDGSRNPIDDSGAPILSADGDMNGTVLVFHDISERRKSEEKIDYLNSVLRAIRNVNQLITKEKDPDRLIEGACKNLIETRGYSHAWITLADKTGEATCTASAGLSERFDTFASHLKEGWLPECHRTALEHPGPVTIPKERIRCADCVMYVEPDHHGTMCTTLRQNGVQIGFLTVDVPLHIVNGPEDKDLFQEVADDIAFALSSIELEKERAEAVDLALCERERLNVTLQSVGDAVISTDVSGEIVLINKVAQDLTGWSPEEAIGKPLSHVFEIVNEITRRPCENPVDKALESNRIVDLANGTLLIAKDGSERAITDSGAPIRDKTGAVTGVVLVFRDVTEQRRLQEISGRAQRLETAGRIAGQIAHDFNNLLGPIVAYPGFIRDEIGADHPALPLIDDMEKAALRISEINQQLLALGRRGHYNQVPLNLNDSVGQVLAELHPLPTSLSIETELSETLMNTRGGPAQIIRILANLVVNAREAMNDIGVLNIRTENFYVDTTSGQYGRVPTGEYVKLTVSDTGSGISAEVLPRIFEPFYTTKTTDKIRGSGLGLSVVHGVVEDHAGYMDVQTTIGRGTSFFVYLPICRDSVEEPQPTELVGGNEKVLVVDDDAIQREVSIRLLEKLGYSAAAVTSGSAAIEYLKQSSVDLLLLDMIMPPGIDGTETYQQALAINPNQKAIIVSGFAENERVSLALEMGAGSYIRKPLTIKSLAAAIRKELDKKPVS